MVRFAEFVDEVGSRLVERLELERLRLVPPPHGVLGGEIWGRYGGDMGEIQPPHGALEGEIWGRYGGDMGEIQPPHGTLEGEIWGRYGGDMGEIQPPHGVLEGGAVSGNPRESPHISPISPPYLPHISPRATLESRRGDAYVLRLAGGEEKREGRAPPPRAPL